MGDKEMESILRSLRKERHLTQLQVQIKTGIDQALISKFENGERTPPTESLIILANFFETSTDYILGRTSVREPYPKKK